MSDALSTLTEWAAGLFARWPKSDTSTVLALVAGVALLPVTLVLTLRSARVGRQLTQRAIEELADRARRRLYRPEELRAEQLWQEAADLQARTGSPLLTEPMAQEAIRLAQVLEEEEHRRKAEELGSADSALKVFEQAAPAYLSVAAINPVYAYGLSILGVGLLAVSLQYGLTWVSGRAAGLTAAGGWALVLVQVWLAQGAVRASRYWDQRLGEFELQVRLGAGSRGVPRPHRLLDFFLAVTNSPERHRVAVFWAPLWEMITFTLAPAGLALIVLTMTLHLGLRVGLEPRDLLVVAAVEFVLLAALFVVVNFGPFFLFCHQYKCFEVKRLKARRSDVERRLVVAARTRPPPPAELVREHHGIQRVLWTITGEEAYRDPKSRLRDILALGG